MINSFESYLKEGKAKKQTPNKDESDSLIEKAKKRLNYIKSKEQNEDNAPFILEDAYEASREAAQSLMALKGYKPYSHDATISFLKEFYKNEFSEQEIYAFDRYRQLRNNSVYRAEKISIEIAKSSLQFAETIIKKI